MKFIRKAFTHIQTAKQLFFASVGTITIALSILGLFLLVYINLNSVLSFWNEQVQVIVYLKDEIPEGDRKQLEKWIAGHSEIDSFEFISRDQAWKDFQSMFSEETSFLKEMGFNPLPASYNLKIKASPQRLDAIRNIAQELKQQGGVESIEYGEEWIKRFETFMILMRVFLVALGALLCLGAVLIIANTVKLSVMSRKDEIELMMLIGATPGFIKIPFFLEGITHGLLGCVVSLGLIKGVHLYLISHFQESVESFGQAMSFQFLSLPFIIIILAASIGVGWLGSFMSLRQFMGGYRGR